MELMRQVESNHRSFPWGLEYEGLSGQGIWIVDHGLIYGRDYIMTIGRPSGGGPRERVSAICFKDKARSLLFKLACSNGYAEPRW